MKKELNIRVEYEPTPIKHLSIQCPKCKNWFRARDITDSPINFQYQLYNLDCVCPKCEEEFLLEDYKINEEESYGAAVYEDCLIGEEKTVWKKL